MSAVTTPDTTDLRHDDAGADALAWCRNRDASPRSAPWPGAHALAALAGPGAFDHGNRRLAPDASLLWAALVAVPAGPCPAAPGGATPAATYRTAFRFGMPLVGGPLPHSSCDFRLPPVGVDAHGPAGRRRLAPRGTFDGRGRQRLFRLYNAMWAGLLAGARRRREGGAGVLPRDWAPRAYLAFAEADFPAARRLACRPDDAGRPRAPAVLDAFRGACRDGLPAPSPYAGRYLGVHRFEAGGAVAVHRLGTSEGAREVRLPTESAADLAVGSDVRVGRALARFGHHGPGGGPGVAAACWFDLQALRLPGRPGLAYLPSALAAPAARDLSRPADLVWDVTRALDHFDPGLGAFLFPPLPARRWDDWRGTLPDEVAYDLTPRDARLCPSGGPGR